MPYSSVSEVVERFPKLEKYPKEAQEMFLKVVNEALEQYEDEGKAFATAWNAIYEKYGRKDCELHFDSVSFDLAEIKKGDMHWDIPTVYTQEGVQNKGFKPFQEIRKAAHSLKGTPVIWRHPSNNRPADPRQDTVVGQVVDVEARSEDRALHGVTRVYTDKVPSWWLNALREGSARAGSVGYFSASDYRSGVFDGQRYERVDRDMMFDHYAVGLSRGACRVEDGCGLRFNSEDGGDGVSLDDLEGEGVVCLDRLKSFIRDTFRRNKGDEKPDGEVSSQNQEVGGESEMVNDQNVKFDEEKKAEYEQKISELEKAKQELAGKVEDFEAKVKESKEAEREALVKDICESTDDKVEEFQGWNTETLKKYQNKISRTQRKGLIAEIVEATEEDPETYKYWNVPQLEHFKKKVVQETGEKEGKAADRTAQTPPRTVGETGEGEGYVPSMLVKGKELTIGNLMEKPKHQRA